MLYCDALQLLGLDVSKSEIGDMLAEVDEDGSGKPHLLGSNDVSNLMLPAISSTGGGFVQQVPSTGSDWHPVLDSVVICSMTNTLSPTCPRSPASAHWLGQNKPGINQAPIPTNEGNTLNNHAPVHPQRLQVRLSTPSSLRS